MQTVNNVCCKGLLKFSSAFGCELTPVMLLIQALDTRMAALRARGRRVVLVGDLNISPAPIDSCEPGEPCKHWGPWLHGTVCSL